MLDGADVPAGDDYEDPADAPRPGDDLVVIDGTDVPSGADDLVVRSYGGRLRRADLFKVVPGLDVTLVVPPNAITVIMSSGGVTAQDYAAADLMLTVDDQPMFAAYQRVIAAPPIDVASWNLHVAQQIAPGVHKFAVKARPVAGGGKATVSGSRRSAADGMLTVMFLKQ